MFAMLTQPDNIAAFEIEDEQLPNLREFALANSIYWVDRHPP